MGDNLYPVNATAPTLDEINQMIGLFKRDAIKDLPVYSIRGNHDCYYDKQILLDLDRSDDQWQMPYYYFRKEIDIGDNGEKLGLLMVDSCLLLCSNYTYGPVNYFSDDNKVEQDHDLLSLRDATCDDPWYVEEGNKMF